MAQLMVRVINSFGTFEGELKLANATVKDATETLVALVNEINNLKMLSIENDGVATIFGEQVLKNSVISARVSEG